ncbi:hypothetical protein ACFOUP_01615 [Belliella kenyensis]|uniref:Uncharacterized protein n=1 Tax=Belliella kenyensis TaxID=1472724 RepID=A0ABV8EI31_9BACT|nr:hypothetical protein [Belliella kenyensis]MCH7401107.1 hypothetical protein [Belliella kenyensis]MDN3604104.1 hypothetical protein [Belliella kenyensis]
MFDIDILTICIAIVLLVTFAVPFYINHLKVKKEKQKSENQLDKLIKAAGLRINTSQQWRRRYFIGLDDTHGKLVYIRDLQNPEPLILDLHGIKKVKAIEISSSRGTGKNSRKIIDELYIELFSHRGEQVATLEFYHGDIFSDLVGEPVILREWEHYISASLKINQEKKEIIV